jgi:hypothetical protein
MNQKKNKLSILYDNHISSITFNINEKSIILNCSCHKKYCHHTDYLIDNIYKCYFENNYAKSHPGLNIYQNENNLWLPVSETENNIIEIIDTELLYNNGKYYYYCPKCSYGSVPINKCTHFDYIMDSLLKHCENLKETYFDTDELSFDLDSLKMDESI